MQEINSPALWLKYFPNVKENDHKYDRGYAVIAGSNISSGSTGASKLAAYAALRSGAGLVSITCDKETAPIYASSMSSVMVKIINHKSEFSNLIKEKKVKSILIGPGNGTNHSTKNNVLEALNLQKNLVLDADALSIFQNDPCELFNAINNDVVLTPHEGEFSRLFSLESNRLASAVNAARLSNTTILLKGHDSIIASPDGSYVINKNAPAFLATAGSGDVLAGLVVGFMAQGVSGFMASCIACYVHSEAAKLFGAGLISEDLLEQIPQVIKKLQNM